MFDSCSRALGTYSLRWRCFLSVYGGTACALYTQYIFMLLDSRRTLDDRAISWKWLDLHFRLQRITARAVNVWTMDIKCRPPPAVGLLKRGKRRQGSRVLLFVCAATATALGIFRARAFYTQTSRIVRLVYKRVGVTRQACAMNVKCLRLLLVFAMGDGTLDFSRDFGWLFRV